MIARALISVSDKRGAADLARRLVSLGVEVLSSGGTARLLEQEGVRVTRVEDYTGAPELFGGRVKTLHPRIAGGILYRREVALDAEEAAANAIGPIDLVVVNLYPFADAVARGASLSEVVEEIDIGGPTLLRAAAKNWAHVGVVVDPADYAAIAGELEARGTLSDQTRYRLASKAFVHTATYDAMIAEYFTSRPSPDAPLAIWPDVLMRPMHKIQALRYGENPHQAGAFYRHLREPGEPSLAAAEQLQGKDLSYNNIHDASAALECAKEFIAPAAVVVKHATPCGVAVGDEPLSALYVRARDADAMSAFGGIVALTRTVDKAAAAALAETFLEAVVAPDFSSEARELLAGKKNLRLLRLPTLAAPRESWRRDPLEVRSIPGGALWQTRDLDEDPHATLTTPTRRAPTPKERADLDLAWKVAKHVRSNAIVLARGGVTVGIGGGQTSRVDAVRIACAKAGEKARGAAMASDAFFPFTDGIEAAARAGVTAVIQPGGSVRDAEVIAAADQAGMAMLFTGTRHFRH